MPWDDHTITPSLVARPGVLHQVSPPPQDSLRHSSARRTQLEPFDGGRALLDDVVYVFPASPLSAQGSALGPWDHTTPKASMFLRFGLAMILH